MDILKRNIRTSQPKNAVIMELDCEGVLHVVSVHLQVMLGAVTPALRPTITSGGSNNWTSRFFINTIETPHHLKDFNYAEEFNKINYDIKERYFPINAGITGRRPADWGHYGAFFIRMVGTAPARIEVQTELEEAGGGTNGLEMLNSWLDNINLDKALLWPGHRNMAWDFWADLILLAGHCALQSMGLPTFGFAAGREDSLGTGSDIRGRETSWLSDDRHHDKRKARGSLLRH